MKNQNDCGNLTLPKKYKAFLDTMKKFWWIGGAWISPLAKERGFGNVLILSGDGLPIMAFKIIYKENLYEFISKSKVLGRNNQEDISRFEASFMKEGYKFGSKHKKSEIISFLEKEVKASQFWSKVW